MKIFSESSILYLQPSKHTNTAKITAVDGLSALQVGLVNPQAKRRLQANMRLLAALCELA